MLKLPKNEIPIFVFLVIAATGAGLIFYFQLKANTQKQEIKKEDKCTECNKEEEIEIPTITPQDMRRKLDNKEKVQVIDVRNKGDFIDVHIPNSISIPENTLEKNIFKINANNEVVIYGYDSGDLKAKNAASLLIKKGFPNIKILENGLKGWREAEFEIERGNK